MRVAALCSYCRAPLKVLSIHAWECVWCKKVMSRDPKYFTATVPMMPRRLSKHEIERLPQEKAFYTSFLTAWKRWAVSDVRFAGEDDKELFDLDLSDAAHHTTLTSPWNAEVWPYKKRFESKCGPQEGPRSRGTHSCKPHWKCTCGIYADKLSDRMQAEHQVFGMIAIWGTVLEWTEGYRAEFAYPTLIVVPDEFPDYKIGPLKKGYETPLIKWAEFAKAIKGEPEIKDEGGQKNVVVKPSSHGFPPSPYRRKRRF